MLKKLSKIRLKFLSTDTNRIAMIRIIGYLTPIAVNRLRNSKPIKTNLKISQKVYAKWMYTFMNNNAVKDNCQIDQSCIVNFN